MKNLVQRFILATVLMVGLVPAFAQSPTPVPALPDAERRTTYALTNQTCACAVNFALYGDSTDYQNWVEVWLNGAQVSYNDPVLGWTITSPTGPIGNIARPITDAVLTFNNPQTGTVQIVGARRPRRTSQFNENAGVSARNLNQVFTDIVAMLREDWDKINDVTGRVILAPPGETMTPLPPAPSRANQNLCFDGSGNPKACAITTAGAITAGNGINVTGSNPATISIAPGPANTFKGSLNGTTTSDLALTACSLAYQVTKWVSGTGWQCGINPVLPSRAIAATLNLSAYSVITTQGYAQPGDGGGATFVNAGTAPFQDSFVTGSTISRAGSGCTNGTDYGSFATGGTGKGLIAVITISSSVLSGIDYTYSPGMGYTVGDVLTMGGGGCSVQPQITVSSVSTPLGSFSDSASEHWQIINEFAVNIKQFGAQPSNTDNFNNIQAAAFFASYVSSPLTQAVGGGRVNVPNGSYTICGSGNSLEIPIGVDFQGASYQAAEIKACSSFNASLNVIELCDPNWHFTCFGAYLDKITITVPGTVASSGFYAVHTNNDQDFGGVYDVYIYGGVRSCLGFDAGYGGASSMWAVRVSCSTDSIYPQIVFGSATSGINLGTTIVHAEGLVLGGSSSGGLYQTGDGIHIYGGFPDISDAHCENMPKCITVDNAAAISNGMASMHNINAGSNSPAPACVAVISLTSANTQQNAIMSMIPQALSCTDTILNGTSGGTSFTSTVTKPVTCTMTCS